MPVTNIRTFTSEQIRTRYEQQGRCCAVCGKPFPIEQMQGAHIVPCSIGGLTAVK